MKTSSAIATCVFALFFCAVSTSAQNNRMDITLQGPWILYVDNDFASNTVLVAFAPGTNGLFAHKPPFFTTGNGIPIDPGTYCIGFDKVCAPQRKDSHNDPITALSVDGYPSTAARPVKVLPPNIAGWKLFDHRSNSGTYLIFPMPDSYSNDGTYKMSFGATFKKPDYIDEEHPIGIQLHYDGPSGGPAALELYNCGTSTMASGCTTLVNSQQNSGTLEVEMKAPRNENVCDWHVRSAYPQMLSLLDPDPNTPATHPQNANLARAFIDIPSDFDASGNGIYDPDCYDCDEQNPDQSGCPFEKAIYTSTLNGGREAMHHPILNVKDQLTAIIRNLREISKPAQTIEPGQLCDLDRDSQKSDLQIDNLCKVWAALPTDFFPTFSQLERLEEILSRSESKLRSDLQLLEAAERKARSAKAEAEALPLLKTTLFQENDLAADVADDDDAKDGKDCRAPLMLLQ